MRGNICSSCQYLLWASVEAHLSPTWKQTNKPTHTRTRARSDTNRVLMCDGVMKSATGCGQRDSAVADESSGTNTDVVLTTDLLWLVCHSLGATTSEPEHSEVQHNKVGAIFFLTCSCIYCDAKPQAVKVAMKLICWQFFFFARDRLILTRVRLRIEATFLLFCIISVFSSGFYSFKISLQGNGFTETYSLISCRSVFKTSDLIFLPAGRKL